MIVLLEIDSSFQRLYLSDSAWVYKRTMTSYLVAKLWKSSQKLLEYNNFWKESITSKVYVLCLKYHDTRKICLKGDFEITIGADLSYISDFNFFRIMLKLTKTRKREISVVRGIKKLLPDAVKEDWIWCQLSKKSVLFFLQFFLCPFPKKKQARPLFALESRSMTNIFRLLSIVLSAFLPRKPNPLFSDTKPEQTIEYCNFF